MVNLVESNLSTISRALSDHHSIGKKTKEEVRKKAKELGYFPNSIASNLRQNRTNSIGVIVPRIDIYFHSLVISGIEEIAYKAGYSVTIYQSKDSFEREMAITNTLQENTAISAIQVFTKAKYLIPKELAVVGFSNYPVSSIIEPTLTTIDDRAFEMGQTAAKMLIRQIEEKDQLIASESIVIKTDLIIRDSTRK